MMGRISELESKMKEWKVEEGKRRGRVGKTGE